MLVHIKLIGWWGEGGTDKSHTCYISTNPPSWFSLFFIELFEIGRPWVIYRTLDTPRCPLTDKHGYIYETKCKGKLGDGV